MILFALAMQLHSIPAQASGIDRTMIERWYVLNEVCHSAGETPRVMEGCRRRDVIQGRLMERGWCWQYPDLPSYQARWHRCE